MATTTFPEWQETNWIRHLKLKGSHNEGKVWSGLVDTTFKLSDTVRLLENVDLYFTGYSSELHISPPSSKEASLSPACPQLSPSQTTCKGKRLQEKLSINRLRYQFIRAASIRNQMHKHENYCTFSRELKSSFKYSSTFG